MPAVVRAGQSVDQTTFTEAFRRRVREAAVTKNGNRRSDDHT